MMWRPEQTIICRHTFSFLVCISWSSVILTIVSSAATLAAAFAAVTFSVKTFFFWLCRVFVLASAVVKRSDRDRKVLDNLAEWHSATLFFPSSFWNSTSFSRCCAFKSCVSSRRETTTLSFCAHFAVAYAALFCSCFSLFIGSFVEGVAVEGMVAASDRSAGKTETVTSSRCLFFFCPCFRPWLILGALRFLLVLIDALLSVESILWSLSVVRLEIKEAEMSMEE